MYVCSDFEVIVVARLPQSALRPPAPHAPPLSLPGGGKAGERKERTREQIGGMRMAREEKEASQSDRLFPSVVRPERGKITATKRKELRINKLR